MLPFIHLSTRLLTGSHLVLLITAPDQVPEGLLSPEEMIFLKEQQTKKIERIALRRPDHWILPALLPAGEPGYGRLEQCRKLGDTLQAFLNEQQITEVTVMSVESIPEETLALAEGMSLGSYQFLRYKTKPEGIHTLARISLFAPGLIKKEVDRLNARIQGTSFARDLVNEPHSSQTAAEFAAQIGERCSGAGISVEVLSKKKLQALQMGGILGVNRGSLEPPVMLILEYKPTRFANRDPVVLVGKGIVFDTGGMNLKPENHMENMKNDMAGGAAVAGTLLALAQAKAPVHVIGLIPATDNRPGPAAIVSGDVLRMHDGSTVEVVNTDAEGRLILADALSYAKRFNPSLVIDLATLTGSAVRAVGKRAMAGMQVRAEQQMDKLKMAGFQVFERIVEFPLWEDYAEGLKSELADVKNLGGAEAGLIIAGKFLERFTGYPYIHLDIAGPAFLDKRDSYRGSCGTGTGVRLLAQFLQTH